MYIKEPMPTMQRHAIHHWNRWRRRHRCHVLFYYASITGKIYLNMMMMVEGDVYVTNEVPPL